MHSSTKSKSVHVVQVTVLIIFAGLCCVSKADFVRLRNEIVAQGQKAVFTCQYPSAITIGWRFNDSVLTDTNSPPDINRTSHTTVIDGLRTIQYKLVCVAQPYYNETKIECVAHLDGGGTETSQPVYLIIQGPLDPATDIRRILDTITWHPPYSLDLTAFERDILYCVEVKSITSQPDERLFKHCNVSTSQYANSSLRQDSIYEITVGSYSSGSSPNNANFTTVRESHVAIPPTKSHIDMEANDTTVDQGNNNSVEIAVAVPVVLLVIIVGIGIASLTLCCKMRAHNGHKKASRVQGALESANNPASPGVGENVHLLQPTPSVQKIEVHQSIESESTSVSDDPSSCFPLVQRKLEPLLESASVTEGQPESQPTIDNPDSSALEERTSVTVKADVGELEQADVNVREYGEKEPATGGTDPSMVEAGGERKQLEADPSVVEEGEQEPTSGEMNPHVLNDGNEELIRELSSGGYKKPQPVHSGIAESGGENTSSIAVTPTRVHELSDRGTELRQTVFLTNSVPVGENKDAKTQEPTSASVMLGDLVDYDAEGIHNLEGGENPNVDDVGSHGKHVCSPRNRPVMEQPKTQAQRAPSTTVSGLSTEGDDACDVSGSGLGTFSEKIDKGGRPVTLTVTIKHT